MRQVSPEFGSVHDRQTVAKLHNLTVDDLGDYGSIQMVSTGLPFALAPIKRLSTEPVSGIWTAR